MAELLFEIFCEEIPARMQVRAGADLHRLIDDGFKKSGITPEGSKVFTGPRRLTYVADVPLRSPDVSEERKGPKLGSPEQALAGFMRGAGLTSIDQAQTRGEGKKAHYVAVIEKPGVDTPEILSELIPSVMNSFPWPKSMKTAGESFRWVRPLQSMICLLGGTSVPVSAGGVTARNVTHGHRRHGAGPFTVTDFADYKSQLEGAGHVLLSHDERKSKILNDAKAACASAGLELVEDEGLLNEVAGLAEWPIVILGDMDPEFLKLPGEVIRLSMRTHQKYFAVRNPKTGELAPNFIVVANQDAPDGGVEIARGNSRVLSARLADAVFFQSEDAKKMLIDYFDKLDTVVFHKKLGSVRDKASRVAALARQIAPSVGADADAAEMAAKLAKCDLVTQTVIEFTSLQGQIGRLMYERENSPAKGHSRESGKLASDGAQADGLDPRVHGDDGAGGNPHATSIALAIEEHYKPQGPSDSVPTDPVAIAVALADKLDTLVGFWAIDEKPTGSKDPYALRRAALGIVRIILENEVRLQAAGLGVVLNLYNESSRAVSHNLKEVLGVIVEKKPKASAKYIEVPNEDLQKYRECDFENLLTFILDRLKGYLKDQGLRHDVIDAILSQGGDDLLDIANRARALQAFSETDDGANLMAGYKRAANILRAEDKKGALPDLSVPVDSAILSHKSEQNLIGMLELVRPKISKALETQAYSEAMTALSSLRIPIDRFFEDVLVNDNDPKIRENRLRLLSFIRDTACTIADFDKIDG